jgi:uncharacterized protein
MGEHHRNWMREDMAARAIALAFEHAKRLGAPGVDIGFFGGEPMLAWDCMQYASNYAHTLAAETGLALRLQMTSNGTLIDAAKANTLKALQIRTTLSIDGTRAAHNAARPVAGIASSRSDAAAPAGRSSYDLALRGLAALADAMWLPDVVCVVSPDNIATLSTGLAELAAFGVQTIHMNPAFNCEFTDAQLVVWERELRAAAELWSGAYRTGRVLSMPTFENKVAAAVNGGLGAQDTCSVGRDNIAVAQ